MPLLSFDVYSNYEEVARLRTEITMLENRLKSFGPGTSVSTIRAVEAQLQSARVKFNGLAMDAAKAGASLEMNIRKGANGAIAAINDLQAKLTNPIQGLTQIAGVAGLGMFLNNVTKIRGQFQLMETNINTLLGGAEKGQAMMAELTEYAKMSPLDFQGTVSAAQMMLGFGIDQQKIIPFMKALGDVSMGDAQRFQSLTLAFSQMSAAGKLMGQDLMQMVNAGFQPLDQLAKDTGKSIGQLKEEMSQGKISAEMVQQAFINATSEGGKFYNMSQSATATITGQMSMLGDATDLMFNDLGKKSEDAIIKVIQGATWLVENYEKVGGVLGTAIATFGIYKASAMASEFAIKVAAEERSRAVVQGFEEEIAKMEEYQRQRALMEFDDDVRGALETGSISTEMAEKIQMMRKEIDVRKEVAEAAVQSAQAEVLAANEGVKAAQERLNSAQELVDAAEQIGDANDQAAAAEELLSARMEYNAAATNLLSAETNLNTANRELNTATTQANAVAQIQQTNATNANTASQTANAAATSRGTIVTALSTAKDKAATIAKYAFTAATNACTKAWHGLKVAFMTNPIGLIITALTTVIGLFMTFKDNTKETTAEVERFGEAAVKAKRNVDTLYAVLDSVNKNSKVYHDSLEELTKIAKEYGIVIDTEKDTLDQLIEKREILNGLILKEGEARQIANRIATYQEDKKGYIDDFIKNMTEVIDDESKGEAEENASRFAQMIADRVERDLQDRENGIIQGLVAQWDELEKELSDLQAHIEYDENGEVTQEWEDRKAAVIQGIKDVQNQIAVTANEEAKSFAASMGMAEDYILDIKDTAKFVKELTDKVVVTNRFIDQTKEKAQAANRELEALKPDTLFDYSSAQVEDLTKALSDVQSKIDNVNKTTASPKVNSLEIKSAGEEADRTTAKIDAIDDNTQNPSVNTSEIEDANEEAQNLIDKGNEIDNISATPFIDTQYIDIALSKVGELTRRIAALDGNQLKYYNMSDFDREQMGAILNRVGNKPKEQWDELDRALFDDILYDIKDRSTFALDGHQYNLTPELSAIYEELRNANLEFTQNGQRTRLKGSAFKVIHPEMADKYDYFMSSLLMTDGERQTQNWRYLTDIFDDRVKALSTTEDFSAFRKQINSAMGKVAQDSEQYRYYEQLLKDIDKRDKSKNKNKNKNTDDPKQRAYELRKARLEEEKRTEELLQEERNRQRELEIMQMEDNSEKEIATIKFISEKKRQELEKQLQKEAEILEKNGLQEWLKGGKNRKEYQYYAQFSEEQLQQMREQYMRQARENIGYDTQSSLIANSEAADLQGAYRTDMEAMRNYLKEYGTFQQKKLAIAEEYAEKIKNAQNKGEELALTAQRDAELRSLEAKAMTSQIDWYTVFDNVGVVMRGQLEPLYKQLQEYVKSEAFRKSGAENQQTVISAMENIRSQLGTNESWRDLSSALADYQLAINELRVATENDTAVNSELARLTAARDTANSNLTVARRNADTTPEQLRQLADAVEAAQAQLDEYAVTVANSNQAMQEAQNRVQSSGTMLSMTAKNVMKPVSKIYTFLNGAGLSQLAELWGAFDELKGGINGLKALKDAANASKDLADAAQDASTAVSETATQLPGLLGLLQQQFPEIMQQISDATADILNNVNNATEDVGDGMEEAGKTLADILPDELLEGLGKAGLIGQIIAAVLKILDILKDGVGTLISSILDSVFGAISGIIDNILSGEIFKQIGESLYKGILGIFKSIFTMGGLFDWWGNGDSDKNLEKDVERLTATNDALRKAVDNLTDVMRDTAVAKAGEVYQKQKSNLEQSMKNTQEMMARSGAAYSNGFLGIGGHKSSNHKINQGMGGSDWSRISKIVGKSVTSASDFWNLTSEQMAKIAQEAPDLYAKIKSLADDGYKDASQYMDDYIEYYKELEELENAYREKLTDVSFDSVKDEFKSMLLDMESSTEDFADNFEKMMQQAVINSLMSSKYNDLIKKWYEDFAAMMEDGTLTEAEQRKARQSWDNIVNSAITDRDKLKQTMGWDGSSTQQSSSRTLAGMSQDTGNAIEGRLTALQIAVESIRAGHTQQSLSLAEMNDELLKIAVEYSRFNVHQDNIERQLAKIYIELQTISENTGAIVKPIQTMQADIAEIKKNTKNL